MIINNSLILKYLFLLSRLFVSPYLIFLTGFVSTFRIFHVNSFLRFDVLFRLKTRDEFLGNNNNNKFIMNYGYPITIPRNNPYLPMELLLKLCYCQNSRMFQDYKTTAERRIHTQHILKPSN